MTHESKISKAITSLSRSLHGSFTVTRQDVEEARKEVDAATRQSDLDRSTSLPVEASSEEVSRMNHAATDFLKGVDYMSTVLMLLVLKFGRATSMLRIVFFGGLLGLAVLIGFGVANYNTVAKQSMILEDQKTMMEEIRKLNAKQDKLLKSLEEAREVQARAAAAAPKVVTDKDGQTKLSVTADKNRIEIPFELQSSK